MSETLLGYTEAFGAEPSDPDIRDYKIAKESIQTEFPETFELKMPQVKNQGSVGSCVAHSIALVAEYFNNKQHGTTDLLSVGYIYGNRVFPMSKSKGMVTRFAISNFCADGTPTAEEFPEHCEVPEIIDFVTAQKDSLEVSARRCRFTSYIKVSKENEIKTALMDGNPVIVAVDWCNGMRVNKETGLIETTDNTVAGGHAIVIYGWDKNGWKFQNSWGGYWGINGCAVWPYGRKIREHYAIIDESTSLLNIEKPFKTNNKFVKFCIKLFNRAFCLGYRIGYKIKNKH